MRSTRCTPTTSAPIAWNGLLYIGVGGGDWGAKGRMLAFDQATGREVWRFDTIPTGKEVGADSWGAAKSTKTGGGGTWTSYTIDVVEWFSIPQKGLSPTDDGTGGTSTTTGTGTGTGTRTLTVTKTGT